MFFSCFFKLFTIKIDQATYIKNLFKVYGKANKENKVKFGFNQPSTQGVLFSLTRLGAKFRDVTAPSRVEWAGGERLDTRLGFNYLIAENVHSKIQNLFQK